jgi:hypothetical protein
VTPREERSWRASVKRALVRVLGRTVTCADCGRPLFTGLPIVWRGHVRVLGADVQLVRVSFATKDSLQFRHVQLYECPAPERPWVR